MSRLYMANGRDFIDLATGKSSLYSEVATRQSYGALWGTFYGNLPNPDPVLRKTNNSIAILDEIRRDAHVSSTARSRKSGVQQRLWRLDQDTAPASTVELLDQMFRAMPMHTIMGEILAAWGYGYKVLEVIWKREGNYILPQAIVGKPCSWFTFGQSNQLLRKTANAPQGLEVEPYKFLLAQHDAEYDNPYGEAQYSLCFWPVTFKRGGLRFWAKFLEKFGMPHAVGKLPRSAPATDRSNLLDALGNMIQDSCSVFPDDASVELIEAAAKGASGDLYKTFLQYHDAEISKVILGHSAGADSTPGKLGNENMALQVRDDIIDGDCRLVESVIDNLIQWILQLNPTLGATAPRFEMYQEEEVDQALATRDKTLTDTGLKFTPKYYQKAYDLEEDDFTVGPAPTAQPPKQPVPPVQLAAAGSPTRPRAMQEIDAMIERAGNEISTETLLAPLQAIVDTATSMEDLRDRVLTEFANADTTTIGLALQQAMIAAELAGRFEIITETSRGTGKQ